MGLPSNLQARCLRARTAWLPAALALAAMAAAQTPPSVPSDAAAGGGPAPALANVTRSAPGVIVGGSYVVQRGTTLQGDVTAIGAAVTIQAGATLDGRLTVVGGSTVIDGTVNEDVRAIGGELTLGDGALVRGDVTTHYAAYGPLPGATVLGRVESGGESPVQFSLPSNLHVPVGAAARAAVPREPFGGVVRSLAIGLLAALLMAAAPARVGRVREAMLHAPVRMGLDGLATALVAIVTAIVLVVTLIGIPLAILVGVLLYATVLAGWMAFGDAVGSALGEAFGQRWSPALRAGIGAFALSLAAAVLAYVPVVGGLAALLLSLVALGAVRATRFGGRAPGPTPTDEPRATVPQP